MTIIQKQIARQALSAICHLLPTHKIDVRINALKNIESTKDRFLLRKILDQIESVFIPKVESIAEIEDFYDSFDGRIKLNLIIESVKGVYNLDDILRSKISSNIEFIFFGNYDYHLDMGLYPITEQDTEAYWRSIKPLIKNIERNNYCFGNSPYANINDTETLKYAIDQLQSTCRNKFAMMCLHKKQTVFLHSLIRGIDNRTDSDFGSLEEDIMGRKLKGRSFRLTCANRIVTPQECILMKRYNE